MRFPDCTRGSLTLPAALVFAVAGVAAQQGAEPSFDVVSIKRNMIGFAADTVHLEGGRFTASNVTVDQLVANAYRVRTDLIVGGPEWIRDRPGPPATGEVRFDVIATIPAGTPPEQVPLMLQRLLADRFQLKAHIGPEQRSTYALVLARPDKRLGPKLTRSAQDCRAEIDGGPLRAPVRRTTEDGKPVCGMMLGRAIIGGGLTMKFLAYALSIYSGRTVVDHTGLDGPFDYELRYAPPPAAAGGGNPPAATDNQPSIFVAIQEQLGLKLEPSVEPVQVVVVDSVSMPTDN
jgi:uncharacterized protein (TIGR03435 family)